MEEDYKGETMFIYQDLQQATDKKNFIKDAVIKFKNSKEYLEMATADKYYNEENVEILKRLMWFYNSEGIKQQDIFRSNNQIPASFYKKITLQEVQYLLGNGITIDDKIKEKLGKNFDTFLNKAGLDARIKGRTFVYFYLDKKGQPQFKNFKGDECIPFYDEKDGKIKAIIRFFQISADRPIYIELYEIDGITEYVLNGTIIKEEKPKLPYKIKVKKDIMGEEYFGENWSDLPIAIYYGKSNHRTTLTVALKNKIDLYDIILSDFGNNLEDNNDVYWVLKNYQGQDLGEFLADYKQYKVIMAEGSDEGGGAEAKTVETPYQARQTALTILRQQIYEDSMSLDMKTLTGGSLTNVAINSAKTDLDLKTDEFEMETLDFIDRLIALYSEYEAIELKEKPKFIRRTITNDTEIIDNIYKMREDIDLKTSLRLNPYIDDDEVEGIVEQLDKENETIYNNIKGERQENPIQDESISP